MFKCHRKDNTSKAWRYLCGLIQGNRAMGETKKLVYDAEYYQFQHFITDSPWDSRPVMDKIAQEADRLIGSDSMNCLRLNQVRFLKQSNTSPGMIVVQGDGFKKYRCQIAVCGALSSNDQSALIDTELYLPEFWTGSPRRCEKAGIPESAQQYCTMAELASRIVERQRQAGLRFACVCVGNILGDKLELCRRLDDSGEKFMVRAPHELMGFPENPLDANGKRLKLSPWYPAQLCILGYHIPPEKQERVTVRKAAAAEQYDVCRRHVWFLDRDAKTARRYWLYERKDHNFKREYFLSNLPEDTTLAQLAQTESNQFLADRAIDDGAEVGMGDYQIRSWRGWHHHMTMVMLAALFRLKHQIIAGSNAAELSDQDIRAMLDDLLLKQARPEQRTMEPLKVPSHSLLGVGKDSGSLKTSSPDRNRVA